MKKSLSFLTSVLCASLAFAEPPVASSASTAEARKALTALVSAELLQPLQRAESRRSKFSRARPVPAQRRVRVLDTVVQTDARGRSFVRFAIDVRRLEDDDRWVNAMVGCAYLEQRQVFVESGDDYVTAKTVLGREDESRPDVCRPAPGTEQQLASARS